MRSLELSKDTKIKNLEQHFAVVLQEKEELERSLQHVTKQKQILENKKRGRKKKNQSDFFV